MLILIDNNNHKVVVNDSLTHYLSIYFSFETKSVCGSTEPDHFDLSRKLPFFWAKLILTRYPTAQPVHFATSRDKPQGVVDMTLE